SQEQILAYALILGFGQQVFTRQLDRKAQDLLEALPSNDATSAPVPPPTVVPELVPATAVEPPSPNGEAAAEGELVAVGAATAQGAATAEGAALPNGVAAAEGSPSSDGGSAADEGTATDQTESAATPPAADADSSDGPEERLG
ncbi:MAG TPA: hypothetical protein VKE25_02285, partial [Actinomycetes bacterium]|nr:hypothetical protein [Actinomycetes bacterium]